MTPQMVPAARKKRVPRAGRLALSHHWMPPKALCQGVDPVLLAFPASRTVAKETIIPHKSVSLGRAGVPAEDRKEVKSLTQKTHPETPNPPAHDLKSSAHQRVLASRI